MRPQRKSASARLRAAASGAILIAGISACADTFRTAGPSANIIDTHADEAFEAFTTRFNQVELSPKYDYDRVHLAQAALVPSRVFSDTVLWETRPSPTMRLLYISGTTADGHYHLDTRRGLDAPARPGDTRHAVALEQLAPSVYRWDTKVDLAVGAITGEEVSLLMAALLRTAEGRTETELRDDYRGAFPRSMAAFGRGFSVDSVRSAPGALGTTSVTVTLGFHPELLRPTYPALSGYLDKYLGPAKYHFALADHAGVALFDVVGRDRSLTARYRVQAGKLTSLFGPPRPWADSLLLTTDVSLKIKHFTVGFHGLLTDFVISNSGRDRSWTIAAQHEPSWDLPFVTERLIRAPLHRPFEGAGALFRLDIRDSAGLQTVFSRRTRLDIQESTIMRFLGSLGTHAIGDLDAKVEVEEDRFIRDGFLALQGDVRALGLRAAKPGESTTP